MNPKLPPKGDARRPSTHGDAAFSRDVAPGSPDAAARVQGSVVGQVVPEELQLSLKLLAEQVGLPFLDSAPLIELDAAQTLSAQDARLYNVVPFRLKDGVLSVAGSNPDDFTMVDSLATALNLQITLHIVEPEVLKELFDRAYGAGRDEHVEPIRQANLRPPSVPFRMSEIEIPEHNDRDQSGVVGIMLPVLRAALQRAASDISLEPGDEYLRIRVKVDGQWRDLDPPVAGGWSKNIVGYIKTQAGMDIAETRRSLDGSIRVRYKKVTYDIRIATLPGVNGEVVTLRILDSRNANRSLADTGLTQANVSLLEELLAKPHGVVIVTGPTGSGKTTTLYAALRWLNEDTRKIITIEDPVEYRIQGLNQIPVNHDLGNGFAEVLKAALRQAPNVIMVGEMRDSVTAHTAIEAATTGHLVLSTLHTNDACSAITRLMDLGVPAFMIAASVRGIVAQRLVRRLCPHCARIQAPSQGVIQALGLAEELDLSQVKAAVGCRRCDEGYSGMMAIHEILAAGPDIQAAIGRSAPLEELHRLARSAGMKTLRADGVTKAMDGLTSPEEVLRATLS